MSISTHKPPDYPYTMRATIICDSCGMSHAMLMSTVMDWFGKSDWITILHGNHLAKHFDTLICLNHWLIANADVFTGGFRGKKD